MTREQKIKRDAKALKKYEQKLRKSYKVISQTFSASAVNNRRARAAAIGACAMECMDAVRGLNRTKKLREGSLDYMIQERKVKDPDGKIGFEYSVSYMVGTYEKAYTDEEIRKEIEETFEKMMAETDEMFPAEVV